MALYRTVHVCVQEALLALFEEKRTRWKVEEQSSRVCVWERERARERVYLHTRLHICEPVCVFMCWQRFRDWSVYSWKSDSPPSSLLMVLIWNQPILVTVTYQFTVKRGRTYSHKYSPWLSSCLFWLWFLWCKISRLHFQLSRFQSKPKPEFNMTSSAFSNVSSLIAWWIDKPVASGRQLKSWDVSVLNHHLCHK